MEHDNTREEANHANALGSVGLKPKMANRIASHNALITGLTRRTVLLSTDDVAAFETGTLAVGLYLDCERKGKPFPLTRLQSIGFQFSLPKMKRNVL